MKKMLMLSLFIMSTQTFAKNVVQTMLEEKSDKTPYEILQDFHNSDGTSVKLKELNDYNVSSTGSRILFNRCASSTGSYLEKAFLTTYTAIKVIPGTPSNGPLFPGTPTQYLERQGLTTSDTTNMTTSEANYDLDNGARWEIETNVKTTFIEPNRGSGSYIEVRRHQDLISFVNVMTYVMSETTYTNTTYGYCWNE